MLKKIISCAAVLLPLVSAGSEAPFVYKQKANLAYMKISPKQKVTIKQPQIVDNEKVFLLKRENAKPGVCGYDYHKAAFRKYPAPGTMVVSWEGKFTGEFASDASVSARYTLKDMPRGSAGRESHRFATGNKWQKYAQEFTIPNGTVNMQYVFAYRGKKDSTMQIKDLTFEFAPDNMKLSQRAPNTKLPPSKWRGVAQLDGFFGPGTGKLAKARTSVRLAYDKKNLYVGFIAEEPFMSRLKADEKKDDGAVYKDDCVEFFFYDPVSDSGKQFMVNAIGTRYDCQLKQAQAGDPYRRHPWNGYWVAKAWKNADSWEAVIIVPWKTLGFDSIPKHPVALNFARERTTESEISQWNVFSGNFGDVINYAPTDFVKKSIQRHRKIERINYLPQRARKVFREVLTDKKHDWLSYIWSKEYQLTNYSPKMRKKHNLDTFKNYQQMLLDNWGRAKTSGIHIFTVWASRITRFTQTDYLKMHEKSGIRFPLTPWIDHNLLARQGAMPQGKINNKAMRVDPVHPLAAQRMERGMKLMRQQLDKKPELRKLISFIHGIDEPCNVVKMLYSRTNTPQCKEWLDEFEKRLRKSHGFGKFDLLDEYAPMTANRPFERIAFWRWWNDELYRYVKYMEKAAARQLPGVPYQVFNRNTCAGNDQIDIALAGDTTYTISCDPYPTSSRAQFSMGRALYHPGYSVKLLRDLAPKAGISIWAQCFNYYQGIPQRAELREWVSQAMKNGLTELKWYAQSSLTNDLNVDIYNEMLEISRQVSELSLVKLPKETATAIYYSDYDRWGLEDRATHAAYTTYSILGEHINCSFRFVSKNGWRLDDIKLLYVPRMRFTDPELTERLMKFIENGGTVVTFDPDFLKFNIDGSSVAERAKLIGAELVAKSNPGEYLLYKKQRMPITRIRHLQLPEANKVHAFDFKTVPAGAKVLATYGDKKPAIIERKIGKGKVIFSSVMPFGDSDAAIAPQGWKLFMQDLAKSVNEKMDLDVWFFELPEVTPKTFNVQPLK